MTARDDLRLMEAIKAGDASAIEAFYDRHSGLVLAQCRRILGDSPEADEASLDSFVQIWERADRFDPGRGGPVAYLMTIARSRAIDRLRSGRRRRSLTGIGLDDERFLDSLASQHAIEETPLDATLSAERRSRVREMLETLDASQRSPLELSFFAGLTHREIAERLEIPLGTVKTRIRQGLLRLRDSLAARGDRAEDL